MSEEAEASVLGAVLLARDALADVAPMLTPADFYEPRHAAIYAAALALYEQGEPADPVTVIAELSKSGELGKIGGGPYLHDLIANVPSSSSAGWYARIVKDRAVLRRLGQAGQRIIQLAESAGDVDEAIGDADMLLRKVVDDGPSRGVMIGDVLDRILDEIDSRTPRAAGLQTGYTDLDMLLHPMLPGQLVVVGARPGVGKSVFASDVARNAAVRCALPVVFASLEMSTDEVVRRMIAAQGRILRDRVDGSSADDEDWLRVAKIRDGIAAAPLLVDDSPTQTLATLRAAVRRHRPRLLVVDYLQLVTPPKAGDRREAVDELSRGLKGLAKTEHLPVLVLSQLNRKVEDRRDGRPSMSDLRESGAIEQDADVLLLLHRPELANAADRPGELDVIVAKQRNGRTGVVQLGSQVHYGRFVDLGRER